MTPDLLHQTATDLRMATFRLARRLRRERAVGTMSDAHLGVLHALRHHGRFPLTTLAEREHVAAASMSNTITLLSDQGYVVRVPDDDDRRRVYVEITEAGAALVDETVRRRDEALAERLEELDLTDAELALLREASVVMRRVAEQ